MENIYRHIAMFLKGWGLGEGVLLFGTPLILAGSRPDWVSWLIVEILSTFYWSHIYREASQSNCFTPTMYSSIVVKTHYRNETWFDSFLQIPNNIFIWNVCSWSLNFNKEYFIVFLGEILYGSTNVSTFILLHVFSQYLC